MPFAMASPQKDLVIYEICQGTDPTNGNGVLNMRFHYGLNIYNEPEPVCLVKTPIAEGSLVTSAAVTIDSTDHLFGLTLTMSQQGQQMFSAISRKYSFKRVALVVDSRIISLATFVEPIDGAKVEIRGIGKLSAERAAALFNGKQ